MPQKVLESDLSQICRICLEANKQNFVDIFTDFCVKKNTWYAEMLSNCTKIRPFQGDGLPRLMCKACSRQLKRTYTFITQCEESDQRLKSYLKTKSGNINGVHDLIVKNEDDNKKWEIKPIKYQTGENYSNDTVALKDSADINVGSNTEDKEGIKLESSYIEDVEDSNWDADDDNLLLTEVKLQKDGEEASYTENVEESNWDANNDNLLLTEVKLQKDGHEPSYTEDVEDSKWDANDDNLLLTEVKLRKDGEGTNSQSIIEHPKKKRGRKKKVFVEGETAPLPESKLPHQCDVCGKLLSTKSNLKAHKICHTDLRPFKCTECPASFKGHSALFQHRKVHTGETPYHCEFCPKRFSRRSALVNHVRMHNGDRQYSCEICLKSFVQSAQLNIHMKRHMGDKSFLCQDCGKGFPIKSDLKVHQRIHNGEKPYSCHLCTKTFATSGNLSIHVRIHNKEVRYNCSECQRGFVTCSAYNVHLKRHKGQRDYHCECGKTFYTSSALKQHKVVHTGEKKYQCKICERKFTQTSHLSRHFKRDHAKPNVPVPSSDHYKVVITQSEGYRLFGTINVEKVVDNLALSGVKCEGS